MYRFQVTARFSAALTALLACGTACSAGMTYYVSPQGSDSAAGSAAAPWKTIQKGLTTVKAGDTLVVRGGSYSGTVTASPNGTSAAPIEMRAAPGERPVLTALVRLNKANYFTWNGVNVTWPASGNKSEHMFKMTDGTRWRITNSEIWGARSYAGILVAGNPSGWSIDHNYVHDTFKSNDTNQDHLIYVNAGMGGGTITRNILSNSPNGRGVKVGPPSGGSSPIGNVAITYNTFYSNTGPSNIQLSYGASKNVISRNIMVKSAGANVSAYKLNGTGNIAYDNIGWESSEVVQVAPGLADNGGNRHEDPGLNLTTFRPAREYKSYGRYAPGDGMAWPEEANAIVWP